MSPVGECVFNIPLTRLLLNGHVAQEASRDQHFVRRLQNALQMRWITLRQRQLFGQVCECNAPASEALLVRDFEQSIEPASDGR